MSRALTIQRSTVPLAERKKYLERLQARRSHYQSANCQFWVFEEVGLSGAFIEFIEASDPDTITAAMASAPHQYAEGARVYREVEL